MAKAKYHLAGSPIPEGMQIFEDRLEVAGVVHRKAAAAAFVRGRGQWLEFEREPGNRYDPNAIKVIGCTKGLLGTKRRHIGYVPAEVADRIAEGGFSGRVAPRLFKTYLGDRGFVEIEFQLLGPAGCREQYEEL